MPIASSPRLRGLTAPSRVLFGPIETNLGDQRALSERHTAFYARRATGGAGVIVTEVASVHDSDWPYERAPLASLCERGWREVVERCRPHGTLVLAGLGHAGGQGSSAHHRQAVWAPSPVADVVTGDMPAVMGDAEIQGLIDGFAEAASAAVGAGCAGVEINAGQHSLLRQFLSGLTNQRTDRYGREPELVPRLVVDAVRAAVGDGLVGLRLCCDELAPGGITPPGPVSLLSSWDVDYVVPVRGSAYSESATRPDGHTGPGFNRELCRQVRGALRGAGSETAVVLQGSVVDVAMADEALAGQECDLVEMTRAQLADPDLVVSARSGHPDRIRPSTLTNQHSQARGPANLVISDDGDPDCGHESTAVPPARPGPALLVVGGGPAGLEAARWAALRGRRVRLVEESDRLGGALRWAELLPGRQRLGLLADWLEAEVRGLGVEVTTGTRVEAGDLAGAGEILLCTGARCAPPTFPVTATPVWSPSRFLRADSERAVFGEVLVYDPVGDATAVAVAELVAAAGARCRLVSPDPIAGQALGRTGDLVDANRRLARAGVRRELYSEVVAVRDGQTELADVHTGERRTVRSDLVVTCASRLPADELWLAHPRLARAGDCVAPRTVHISILEGRRAVAFADSPGSPGRSGRSGRSGHRADRGTAVSGTDDLGGPRAPGPADLGEPLVLRGHRLPNRVVFAAHLTNFAAGGRPTEVHAAYYAARARGGAGMVITEEHSVHPGDHPYEKLIRGHDPAVLPGYRVLTDAVHAHGVPVLAQLNHNGAQSTGDYTRRPVWAPSAVPDPTFREVPVAVTTGQITELIAGFADVAVRCVAGGFDGVELQASQSSIVRQFLDPATNRRTDEYGGTPGNRARFLLELVAALRAAIGPDRILGVRLGVDTLAEDRIEQICRVAGRLAPEADYLNTAVGVAGAGQHRITPPMGVPAGYALEFAAAVREASGLPVVASGRFTTPEQANTALRDGRCDLVAVVRGQLADPGWGAAATAGGPVRTCLGCNQECVGRVGMNVPLSCVRNPRAGRESVRVAVTRSRRVLVVGGGPAGLRAAVTAAGRGHRVTLCERDAALGGQVVLAARAPGRGELRAAVTDLVEQCRGTVEVRTGTELDESGIREFGAQAVVLATGSRPRRPDWMTTGVCDVRDVLGGRVEPRGDVLVYDELGFHQAAWTAVLLAERGCTVELMTPAMVAAQHLGLTLDRPRFRRRAAELGIRTWTDRVVVGARTAGGRVHLDVLHHITGRHERRDYSAVICALPAVARDELSSAAYGIPIHRVGDCWAPRRLDAAIREGDRVVEAL